VDRVGLRRGVVLVADVDLLDLEVGLPAVVDLLLDGLVGEVVLLEDDVLARGERALTARRRCSR
jgi:hypothetical protein